MSGERSPSTTDEGSPDSGANVTDPDGPDVVPPPRPVGMAPTGKLGALFAGLDPNPTVRRSHKVKPAAAVPVTTGPNVQVNISDHGAPEAPENPTEPSDAPSFRGEAEQHGSTPYRDIGEVGTPSLAPLPSIKRRRPYATTAVDGLPRRTRRQRIITFVWIAAIAVLFAGGLAIGIVSRHASTELEETSPTTTAESATQRDPDPSGAIASPPPASSTIPPSMSTQVHGDATAKAPTPSVPNRAPAPRAAPPPTPKRSTMTREEADDLLGRSWQTEADSQVYGTDTTTKKPLPSTGLPSDHPAPSPAPSTTTTRQGTRHGNLLEPER